jgi:DNA (cytosine-5)-methyltransferase 1
MGKLKLRSLDLFSGVGGNSLALQSVLKTVAYCEIDPFARSVLGANMKNRLEHAPIFPDVTKLKARDIPALPDVITASFPCQDISIAGTGAGLSGARSGLVRHVLRLVDEFDRELSHSVSYVFFENSSHIRTHGLATLVAQLKRRKFACVWCDVSAADVGARHIRRRWFMLATRAGAARAPAATVFKHNFGALDAVPRLVRTAGPDASADSAAGSSRVATRKDSRLRIGALGNAVVPTAVSVAWNRLQSADVAPGAPTAARDLGGGTRPAPTWAALKYDNGRQVREYWPTPVHHPRHWYPTNRLDGRYFNTFGTRVFHEAGTMRAFRYTDVIAARSRLMLNPVWVETLMGFPKGWTVAA